MWGTSRLKVRPLTLSNPLEREATLIGWPGMRTLLTANEDGQLEAEIKEEPPPRDRLAHNLCDVCSAYSGVLDQGG